MSLAQILAFLAIHPNFASNHPGLMAHVDLDSDGYSGATDCDDRDPTTHPGAVDAPFDGIDQDCDGINACEFEIEQADGSFVTMPNKLIMQPNASSPVGPKQLDPLGQEVLRFDLTLKDSNCPSVTWTAGTLGFDYTDFAGTNWQPFNVEVIDLSIGWYATIYDQEELDAFDNVSMSIPNVEITGYTHQISVRANFTGANADRVHVDVYGDTMIWCSLGACSDINTDVIGRTLFF